jgi:hypothetical protein
MKPVRPLTRPLTNRRNRRCGVELSRSPRLPGRRFKSGPLGQSALRRDFRTAHEPVRVPLSRPRPADRRLCG